MATSSNPSMASFELFPNLPTEIRLKVWRHALPPHPGVVRLRKGRCPSTYRYYGPYIAIPILKHDYFMAHVCHAPAVLQVNQEARDEGLKLHKLRFPDTNPPAPPGTKSYFASSDILYLLSSSFRQDPRPKTSSLRHDDPIMALFALTKSLPKDQMNRVQNLAVDARCESHLAQPRAFLKVLRDFKGLKLLLFVLDDGRGCQEGGTFIHPPFDLRKECLAMQLKIQKIFEDGWDDIVRHKPEWHIVTLGRDQEGTMTV